MFYSFDYAVDLKFKLDRIGLTGTSLCVTISQLASSTKIGERITWASSLCWRY